VTKTTQAFGAEALERAPWRKSTHSGNGDSGGCVEVAPLADGYVAVRHTKDRGGPVVVYNDEEWRAFTAGVRDGEFDF